MPDPVLTGLTKRRQELLAEIKKQEGVLRGLLADLDHLDGTMRQFDPAHRGEPPQTSIGRRPRGAVTKALLTVLRQASEPLTVREATMRAMLALGLDCRDRKEVGRMADQCRTVLANQRKNGTVMNEVGLTGMLLWNVRSQPH